jgi:hypothetical protein
MIGMDVVTKQTYLAWMGLMNVECPLALSSCARVSYLRFWFKI